MSIQSKLFQYTIFEMPTHKKKRKERKKGKEKKRKENKNQTFKKKKEPLALQKLLFSPVDCMQSVKWSRKGK